MKIIFVLILFFSVTSGYSQILKKFQGKGPTEEEILVLRKHADAAFVVIVQEIISDTCRSSSEEETFIVTGKIIKKYYDHTGNFKGQKLTFITKDTSAYTAAPYYIVFLNRATEELTEKCKIVHWTSQPSSAFPYTSKTEELIGKKHN